MQVTSVFGHRRQAQTWTMDRSMIDLTKFAGAFTRCQRLVPAATEWAAEDYLSSKHGAGGRRQG